MIGLPGNELWRLRRWRLRFLALSNAPRVMLMLLVRLNLNQTGGEVFGKGKHVKRLFFSDYKRVLAQIINRGLR